MQPFGSRLRTVVNEHGPLCVGIDPHAHLLKEWGLPDAPDSLVEFGLRVVEAAAGRVGVVKPQVAFFERHGSAGFTALEQVLAAAREAGLTIIGDAKRGDVGTSVDAYGQAWLGEGTPLEVDALTVSAFQGVGSLASVIDLAKARGKGLFVLCATSNPEARIVQSAILADGRSVARLIAEEVAALNDGEETGSFGLVIGATVNGGDFGLDLESATPILAPGFGAQGGALEDLRKLYPTDAPVLASVSRSVLQAGPQRLAVAIDEHRARLKA